MLRPCKHCSDGYEHQLSCACSHHHNDHSFAGGCHLCSCSHYDQSEKKAAKKPVKKVNDDERRRVAEALIEDAQKAGHSAEEIELYVASGVLEMDVNEDLEKE
jgi:hypothetical protein